MQENLPPMPKNIQPGRGPLIGAVWHRRSGEERKSSVLQFLQVIRNPLIESPLGNTLHIDGLRIDDIGK